MMNHAAWVNNARSEERVAAKKDSEVHPFEEPDGTGPVWKGKRADELDVDELAAYFLS